MITPFARVIVAIDQIQDEQTSPDGHTLRIELHSDYTEILEALYRTPAQIVKWLRDAADAVEAQAAAAVPDVIQIDPAQWTGHPGNIL